MRRTLKATAPGLLQRPRKPTKEELKEKWWLKVYERETIELPFNPKQPPLIAKPVEPGPSPGAVVEQAVQVGAEDAAVARDRAVDAISDAHGRAVQRRAVAEAGVDFVAAQRRAVAEGEVALNLAQGLFRGPYFPLASSFRNA